MDTKSKVVIGSVAVLSLALAVAVTKGCRRPEILITGITLRHTDGAHAPFRGYYVADGVTNYVQGSMPKNYACVARSLVFVFIRQQQDRPGFDLTISRSDRMDRIEHGQYGIRGYLYLNKDGSDRWACESFNGR